MHVHNAQYPMHNMLSAYTNSLHPVSEIQSTQALKHKEQLQLVQTLVM